MATHRTDVSIRFGSPGLLESIQTDPQPDAFAAVVGQVRTRDTWFTRTTDAFRRCFSRTSRP